VPLVISSDRFPLGPDVIDPLPPGWRGIQRLAIPLVLACTLPLASASAWASFGGTIRFGFWGMLIGAMVLAIPVGIVCAAIEAVGAKRSPPAWAGMLAAVAGLWCLGRALGWIGKSEDGVYWFAIPPLFTLALVAIVRLPIARLGMAWLLSVVVFSIAVYKPWPNLSGDKYAELIGALAGGAITSMLFWQLAYWLRQLQLSRAARREAAPVAPEPQPLFDETAVARGKAAAAVAASAAQGAMSATTRLPWGIGWFLAGTLIFYAGIAILIAFGYDSLSAAMRGLEWRIADYFGLPTQGLNAKPLEAWAGHGILWSMVAGVGAWGAAAVAGRFDPGQLRYLRFAAVFLCAVMLLSVAVVASNTRLY
jgi:hypothetical protein